MRCGECFQTKTRMQPSLLMQQMPLTTEIATYVINCYSTPARLFVVGGLELKSQEGTTQGDPLGMAIYALRITPMMNLMLVAIGDQHNKMVGFADDISAAGSIEALKQWLDHVMDIGPNYG